MARKWSNEDRRPFSRVPDNTASFVPFLDRDLTVKPPGGGGDKELVPVTQEYRNILAGMASQVSADIGMAERLHPAAQSIIVMRLRPEGIAKSHRPIALIAEAGLRVAGHGAIDEMLVQSDSAGVRRLEEKIRNRNTKKIRANLSAIVAVETWGPNQRLKEERAVLRGSEFVIVRLFSMKNRELNISNLRGVETLLVRHEAEFEELQTTGESSLPLVRIVSRSLSDGCIEALVLFPGIRSIYADPTGYPSVVSAGSAPSLEMEFPDPAGDLPIVAVFDTGVSADAGPLKPWVASRDPYVIPPDTDYVHGTAVASLVVGAKRLNDDHASFPDSACLVHDVCALEANGSNVSDLMLRVSDAVAKAPHVKVWNLSLGEAKEVTDDGFSAFAQHLDSLSTANDVLFVVAAGNYDDNPRRKWPPAPPLSQFQDRIGAPADCVRGVTVGSVTHLDAQGCIVEAGKPSPFSRRGPGPVFTPKPDIVHLGGGVHEPWLVGETSLNVMAPDGTKYLNVGTSFAAPIAASMAATIWKYLDHAGHDVRPEVVKTVLIHAAQLSSPEREKWERRYYGSGLPADPFAGLQDGDDSFTLLFEAGVVPGFKWRKTSFPIPACLIHDGKFRGEIIITSAYAPPLDASAGSEYVRANVRISFGSLVGEELTGKVPPEGELGSSGFETAQIEHGGKWSPVKIHRQVFPSGTAVDQWCLQLEVFLRADQPQLTSPLQVPVMVTIRALDGDSNVYADGQRALAALNWAHAPITSRVQVR